MAVVFGHVDQAKLQFGESSCDAAGVPPGKPALADQQPPMKRTKNEKKKRKKRDKSKRGPIPDFGFFERDKRKALQKQKHASTQRDSPDAPPDTLTEWEEQLTKTSWKDIKRLSDDASPMVG